MSTNGLIPCTGHTWFSIINLIVSADSICKVVGIKYNTILLTNGLKFFQLICNLLVTVGLAKYHGAELTHPQPLSLPMAERGEFLFFSPSLRVAKRGSTSAAMSG
jgi:hypothetical protein